MKSVDGKKIGWRGRMMLICAAALIALLACELGARWLYLQEYARKARMFDAADMMLIREPDKEYEFSLKRNHSGSNVISGWSWRLTTNSRGMRGREIEPAENPDTFRVLFLGDSVTFGVGVEDEEVFPVLVEKRLNGIRPTGAGVHEAVNLSAPGYNLHQAVALLEEQIDLWRPDFVALTVGPNDAEPQFSVPAHPRHSLRDARLWFLERVRSSLNDLFHGGDERFRRKRLQYDADWLSGWTDGSPKRRHARRAFTRIAELCGDRGIPLMSMYVNTCDPTLLDDGYAMVRETLDTWAREENIPHVDLFKKQSEHDFRDLWINGDAHPNAFGHQIIADSWSKVIEARLRAE